MGGIKYWGTLLLVRKHAQFLLKLPDEDPSWNQF